MPPDKLFFVDWDRDRFLGWADKIGTATRQVVEAILNRAVVEQQAYRSCFGILSLREKFGPQRLEGACGIMVLRRLSSFLVFPSFFTAAMTSGCSGFRFSKFSSSASSGSFLLIL